MSLIVTEQELRSCVKIDADTLARVEDAFTWLADGRVAMPPVMHVEIDATSDVDIKSAYVRGQDAFAVKIASGFFDNPSQGLPSSSGLMVLLSARTGLCQGVLLDNGYLTDLRTGLAGAVCARHLAPTAVHTVGVVGSGAQARYQVESLRLVRDFERLLVFGRTGERVSRYVDEVSTRLSVAVEAANSLEQLVRESQLVVTTTPSIEPLVRAEWLHPGLHITAMGADLPGKQELEERILAAADLVVCDSHSQCVVGGELQHLGSDHGASLDTVVELGQITSGRRAGRTAEEQITVADLTGTGVQDTAIALAAFARARDRGLGATIGPTPDP